MNIKQKRLSNAGQIERWMEEKIKERKEATKNYYITVQKYVPSDISFPVWWESCWGFAILITRYENCVAQESPKQQFWA